MEVVRNSFMPGDPRLIDQIVYELKSQGIFDQFRKECISDVDTKPAYQNLRQRVEGSVSSFLKQQKWRPDMNKNQVREMLRKSIHESGYLETGVERIVDQVVNPKINSVFLPQVEDVVYRFLGIERPDKDNKQGPLKIITQNDLLPTDLEAVSPESTHNDKKDNSANLDTTNLDDSKIEEDESPPFEPLDEQSSYVLQEENSVDSHMSGLSGMASDSNNSVEMKIIQAEGSNQDSHISQNSSESRLSIVTSEENTKMEICEDTNQSKSELNVSGTEIDCNNEKIKDSKHRDDKKRSSYSSRDKDKERKHSTSSSSNNKDKPRHSSSSSSRDKDKKEHKSSSSKSGSSTSKDKEKDKNRSSSSSNRHSSSSKDKSTSKSSTSSSSRDKDKSKSSSSSSSAHKSSDKSKSSSSSDKHKKYSSSSSSKKDSKDKDRKKDSKKDDHYSSRDKKSDRRSTDRDSNDGQSSKQGNGSTSEQPSSQTQKSTQESSSKSSNGNGSGDSGNSDNIESKTINLALADQEITIAPKVKLYKPKFASNFQEARRLMKIRKKIAKLEKQQQLGLASFVAIETKPEPSPEKVENVEIEEEVLKSSTISQESFEALEARLLQEMSNVNYNTYESPDDDDYQERYVLKEAKKEEIATIVKEVVKDTPVIEETIEETTINNIELLEIESNQNTIEKTEEPVEIPQQFNEETHTTDLQEMEHTLIENLTAPLSDCLLKSANENDQSPKEWLFLEPPTQQELKSIDILQREIKLLEDNMLQRNSKVVKSVEVENNRKRKIPLKGQQKKTGESLQKRMKMNNNKVKTTEIPTNNNFPLPLSPSDSESNEKKEEIIDVPIKQRRSIGQKSNQRYSSDDLYKPRPMFASSRRRGAQSKGE